MYNQDSAMSKQGVCEGDTGYSGGGGEGDILIICWWRKRLGLRSVVKKFRSLVSVSLVVAQTDASSGCLIAEIS